MFKALKENKIISISDTDSEFKFLVKDAVISDSEHTTADYTMVGSEYVLNSDEKAVEVKEREVRSVRNSYLEATDKYMIVDFPISDAERDEYKAYRHYLRDYPEVVENWWKAEPLVYEEWKQCAEA